MLQITWNLSQEFDILCQLKIQCLFLRLLSKCLPFFFFGRISSQNLATIVSKDCYNCCMRICFLKLGYSENKHKYTLYVLFTDRDTSIKEWITVYSPLFEANNIIFTYFFKGIRWSAKCFTYQPRVWFALAKSVQSSGGKMIPQEKMEVNGLHLYLKHLSFKIVFLTHFAGLNP